FPYDDGINTQREIKRTYYILSSNSDYLQSESFLRSNKSQFGKDNKEHQYMIINPTIKLFGNIFRLN
ncbi:TPA: hypothetical protein ACGECU_005560, partial [Klebsiella pneumoniae]